MKLFIGLAGLAMSNVALAADFTVSLATPPGGRILHGFGGLHAVDAGSQKTLVRLISPGNPVRKFGTIRVLVLNLGSVPFQFGPEHITLTVGDTKLAPVSMDKFIDGAQLIERERNRARTIEIAKGGALGLAGTVGANGAFSFMPDESALPGTKTLEAIYQLLETQNVEPSKGWGGYYVFNFPKSLRTARSDQPLVVTVTTGTEVRRFYGVMRYS